MDHPGSTHNFNELGILLRFTASARLTLLHKDRICTHAHHTKRSFRVVNWLPGYYSIGPRPTSQHMEHHSTCKTYREIEHHVLHHTERGSILLRLPQTSHNDGAHASCSTNMDAVQERFDYCALAQLVLDLPSSSGVTNCLHVLHCLCSKLLPTTVGVWYRLILQPN